MTLTDPILKFLLKEYQKFFMKSPFTISEECYCCKISGKYHFSPEAEYHRKHKNEQSDIHMM